MMAIWAVVTVLYRPAVAPDQPWASRRLVPFVLPGLILAGIWAAAWLKGQAAQLGRTRATATVLLETGVVPIREPVTELTLEEPAVPAYQNDLGIGDLTPGHALPALALGTKTPLLELDQGGDREAVVELGNIDHGRLDARLVVEALCQRPTR